MFRTRLPTCHSPEVLLVVEVPGGRVTHDFSPVGRTADHRVVPELLWHRDEAEGREELLRHEEEAGRIVTLRTDRRHVFVSCLCLYGS